MAGRKWLDGHLVRVAFVLSSFVLFSFSRVFLTSVTLTLE